MDITGFSDSEFGITHETAIRKTIHSEIAPEVSLSAITLATSTVSGNIRVTYTITGLTEQERALLKKAAIAYYFDSDLKTVLKERFSALLLTNGINIPFQLSINPNALSGVKAFFIGVVLSLPFICRNPNGPNSNNNFSSHSGYLIDLLNSVQARAAESCSGTGCNQPFEYYLKEIAPASDDDYGAAIEHMRQSIAPKFDMLLGAFKTSATRAESIDFTSTFAHSSLTVITYEGTPSPKPPATIVAIVAGASPYVACLDVLSDSFTQRNWLSSNVLGTESKLIPMLCYQGSAANVDQRSKTKDLPGCLEALKAGTCSLVIMDKLKGQYHIATDNTIHFVPGFFGEGKYSKIAATSFLALPLSPSLPAVDKSFLKLGLGYQLEQGVVETLRENYFDSVHSETSQATPGSLSVHNVDIILVVDPPYSAVQFTDGKPVYSGYMIDMIEAAADYLGFQYQLHMPSDADPANGLYGTYGQGQKDVENDSAVGDMYWSGYFITQGRMEKSWFASPYKDLGLQLLVKTENDEQSLDRAMSAVLYPFMPELWALIICTAVFAALVMWYHESPLSVTGDDIDGAFGRTLPGLLHNLPRMMYVTYGSLTGFICHAPKTGAGRLFGFFYILFCMLLCSAYTANLASIMTIMASTVSTTSLDELISSGSPICALQNTAYAGWLKRESPWAAEINILEAPVAEMLPNLRKRKCLGIIGTGMMVDGYLTDDVNCDLAKNGQAFWRQNLGVGIRKVNTLVEFRDQLSLWIVQARANSFISDLDTKYLTKASCTAVRRRLEGDAEPYEPIGASWIASGMMDTKSHLRRWLKGSGGSGGSASSGLPPSDNDQAAVDEQLEQMRLGVPHLLGIVLMTIFVGITSMLLEHFLFEPLKLRNMEKAAARCLSVLISRDGEVIVVNMSSLGDAWDKLDMYKEGQVDTRTFKYFFRTLLQMMEPCADNKKARHARRKKVLQAVDVLDSDRSGNVELMEFREYWIEHLQDSSATVPIKIVVDAEDEELVAAMKRNERNRRRRRRYGECTHTFRVYHDGVEETHASATQAAESQEYLRMKLTSEKGDEKRAANRGAGIKGLLMDCDGDISYGSEIDIDKMAEGVVEGMLRNQAKPIQITQLTNALSGVTNDAETVPVEISNAL
jgi:ABC-type amino acid transport substrate-binding protein